MLEDEENNSDTFVLHPFISYSSRFDVKDNTIVELFKADERNIEMIVSHLFFTEENRYLPFFYKVRNGETIETKSITNFRYCEMTVEGMSMVSLGLFNAYEFKVKSQTHMGWVKGTIGYHADDGCIFHDGMAIAETKPYGDIAGAINTVGVGINGETSEVFFTFNGEVVFKKELGWDSYYLGIGCENIHPLHLNCGDEPFLYQF